MTNLRKAGPLFERAGFFCKGTAATARMEKLDMEGGVAFKSKSCMKISMFHVKRSQP